MKKILLGCIWVVAVFCLFSGSYAPGAHAAKPTKVEVLYMNHGPLMDTLDKMKSVFSSYGDSISVSWYDFESKEGEDFKTKKGINQHVPLVIWIDGNSVVTLRSKQVKFVGYPTGAGPALFQGKWSIDDLTKVLDQATSGK
ncbi:MAG: hypothetical protein P8175_01665 [Deltaproteobacteria bacterium]